LIDPAVDAAAMGQVRVGISSWADAALIEDGSFYPKKSMSAEARLQLNGLGYREGRAVPPRNGSSRPVRPFSGRA
jgi:hypothetical protein